MKQREIQVGKTTWTCVQALAGVDGAAAAAAQRHAEQQASVAVVCTPSGGAQSTRLALSPDWLEALDDHQLAAAITAAGPGAGVS